MFDVFAQVSFYEFLAVLTMGFGVGFLFLPRLFRNPIIGLWVMGIGFSTFRFVSSPEHNERSLVAMILWTTMVLGIYIGRYVVKRVFHAHELIQASIIDTNKTIALIHAAKEDDID